MQASAAAGRNAHVQACRACRGGSPRPPSPTCTAAATWPPPGMTQPDGRWGRPSGLARLPDGSMLLGDDGQAAVYRISYEPGTRG